MLLNGWGPASAGGRKCERSACTALNRPRPSRAGTLRGNAAVLTGSVQMMHRHQVAGVHVAAIARPTARADLEQARANEVEAGLLQLLVDVASRRFMSSNIGTCRGAMVLEGRLANGAIGVDPVALPFHQGDQHGADAAIGRTHPALATR